MPTLRRDASFGSVFGNQNVGRLLSAQATSVGYGFAPIFVGGWALTAGT
jgi:hypothetical protein